VCFRAFPVVSGDFTLREKRPPDIPVNPERVYANDAWQGFGDWLGNGNARRTRGKFRPFVEAREFAQGLRLKCAGDWRR